VGTADSAWHWGISTPPYAASYAKNDWLLPTPGLNNSVLYPADLIRKETAVQNASATPMFMDSVWINLDPLEKDSPGTSTVNLYSPGDSYDGMERVCIARHGGRPAAAAPKNFPRGNVLPGTINVGFVDVHVEQAKLENLWTYSWHLNWKIPSPHPP
jgi:hypothetical protein